VGGDWKIPNLSEEWEEVDADYARYVFYVPADPPPPTEVLGVGYYYWQPDWPLWAFHTTTGTDNWINIDFVDMPFPP
jgi:hypothetical protein